MAQTDLQHGSSPPSGVFNAAEQSFFQQGEAMESGEISIDELTATVRRPRLWPRVLLMGAGVGLVLLVLSLAVGRKQSGDAVALVPQALAAPSAPLAAPAPPAMVAPAAVVTPAPEARPVTHAKAKKIERKRAHHARAKRH
jgi:hypothetical protein